MGFQLSKYPLTPEQCREYKVPEPPKLTPVIFTRCGHGGRIFPNYAPDLAEKFRETGETQEFEDLCWACKSR